MLGAEGARGASAVSPLSVPEPVSTARSEARTGGVPRCRVLRLRRDSGSDWGRAAGTAGVDGAGTDGSGVERAEAGADGAEVAGPVGGALGRAAAGTSPPRMRSRVEPGSSASVSRAGGAAGAAVDAADPGRASAGRDACGLRSMGVRARCGWTPRGGAGAGLRAAGRGVGVGLRGAGIATGAGGGVCHAPSSTSPSSSHGFGGMGMPPLGACSLLPAEGGVPRRGLATRGALIRPVKLAIRPCDSGSWAIPVGRIVTAYEPAGSTLVVMSVSRGLRGAMVRKSPR